MSFGGETLFHDVSFQIEEYDRIGFVGVNGAGKTTLFQLMRGALEPDAGSIAVSRQTKIGYMQQKVEASSDKTVWEYLMEVFSDMTRIEQQLEQIARDIEQGRGNLEELVLRQTRLQEQFEARGGYTYQNVARSALIGLGFDPNQLGALFETLSGGQKTRVQLCRILLSDANLLLLDEPTNHLDISSVQWLENFLANYKGAFVVISHDRYFLDRITERTFELENGHLTVYPGNYSTYVKLKQERREAMERKYENTRREIKRLEGVIAQQKTWSQERNYRIIDNKQKVIDRLEQSLEKPEDTPEGMRFHFPACAPCGNEVLSVRDLSMAFGIQKLFSGIDLDIRRKERVFLLGPNGCGKTTLLKILLGKLRPLSGTVRLGSNVKIGYYDQAQTQLCESKTVFDEVYDAFPQLGVTQVRNALAAFLFYGDDVEKPISVLSGGERAKVCLCKLLLSGANVLLLDEPTNHLDISSREALEEALSEFTGTLFVISHDRYFINKLAQRILYMESARLINYPGNYDYFIEKHTDSEIKTDTAGKRQNRMSYKEQKEYASLLRRLEGKVARAQQQIEVCEAELAALEEQLTKEANATDYVKAAELVKQIEEKKQEQNERYDAWEAAEQELAQARMQA